MKYLTFGSTTAVTAVTVKTTSGNPTDMIQYNSPEVSVIGNEERRIPLFKVQPNMFSTLELNDTHR